MCFRLFQFLISIFYYSTKLAALNILPLFRKKMSYSLLDPAPLICHHKVFTGRNMVTYIFKLWYCPKLYIHVINFRNKCESRKVDIEDICYWFSMVYNIFLTVSSKMGFKFCICGDMLLSSSEWLPKVTL